MARYSLPGLAPQRAAGILTASDLTAQTDRTTTDLDHLLDEIAATRERGYALIEEEMDAGISAIAAPFFHPRGGDAVGAVSVAGPASRLTRARLEAFHENLRLTAKQVSSGWAARQYAT